MREPEISKLGHRDGLEVFPVFRQRQEVVCFLISSAHIRGLGVHGVIKVCVQKLEVVVGQSTVLATISTVLSHVVVIQMLDVAPFRLSSGRSSLLNDDTRTACLIWRGDQLRGWRNVGNGIIFITALAEETIGGPS